MKKNIILFAVTAGLAFASYLFSAKVSTLTGMMVEQGFTVVPLKRAHNQVYASCSLNGKSADLAVDTGSSHTLINSVNLKSLGLPLTKVEGDFYGGMGPAAKSVNAAEIKDFQVGAYHGGAHPAGAWDFSYQQRPGRGLNMNGLLGIDFLYRHQAVIDCFQMNLFLKSPSAPSSSAALSAGLRAGGCTEIPIHVARDGLAVATRINGRSGYLILDTGAAVTYLREHAIADLNMRRGSISATTAVGIMDVGKKVARVQMAYFTTMEIGSFNVPLQAVGVADLPTLRGGGPGDVFFGYLGQDLLAYYVGIIDCHALKLYLRLDPVIEAERKKHQS